MVRPERERLDGLVEIDETYMALGDREQPVVRGRGKGRKSQSITEMIDGQNVNWMEPVTDEQY